MNKTPPKESTMSIALCGNPNSGKTTLFNRLTGSNQKVGNWPGVTVEYKSGTYVEQPSVSIIDTPGIYSLTPFTLEEQVTLNYLLNSKPDLVINIVDSTNLERNLFLTTQLLELDLPVVVALNMQDEAEEKGISIDKDMLQRQLGCQFFSISASKGEGITEMMQYCTTAKQYCNKHLRFDSSIENALLAIAKSLPPIDHKRWQSIKLLELDKDAIQSTSQAVVDIATQHNAQLASKLDHAITTEIASQRYSALTKLTDKATVSKIALHNTKEQKAQQRTEKIDKIVLNKWLAFPIFALIMTAIFYISLGGLGGALSDLINQSLTPWLQSLFALWLAPAKLPWLQSLICDGILSGVMGVVSFVPQIMLLFGFISILEASGYMSRIAFITDKLLVKIGLGGKSFVSMILGCGCSVPAIMATRTIKNVNERNTTITLTPMMPCSAKMAIIAFFTAKLLGGNPLIAVSFYFISILSVIFVGQTLKVFGRRKANASDTFIMELPEYRLPTIGAVLKQMWERGKAFLIKAGTIILLASIVLWVLETFNWSFEMVQAQDSILADIGRVIAPIFIPLGFGTWEFSVATITGIAAKETVVTTLEILFATTDITTVISSAGAYSFVVYNLLTIPCIATVSASITEQGGVKRAAKSILIQVVTAYVVSLVIYQLTTLALNYTKYFVITVTCCVLLFVVYLAIRYLVKKKGCNCECHHCPHIDNCNKDK